MSAILINVIPIFLFRFSFRVTRNLIFFIIISFLTRIRTLHATRFDHRWIIKFLIKTRSNSLDLILGFLNRFLFFFFFFLIHFSRIIFFSTSKKSKMIKKVIHAKWIKILSGVAHPFFFYIYIYIHSRGKNIVSPEKIMFK